MPRQLIINGTTYSYPEPNDMSWGQSATEWATAITNGMLQKAGGSFPLTSEVDFGFGYGLKSFYYKTKSSNISTTGNFRLARTDTVSWRNQANTENVSLTVNDEDRLEFNSSPLGISILSLSSETILTIQDSSKVILLNPSSSFSVTLPDPSLLPATYFTFKDISGSAATNPIQLLRFNTEKIEGVSETYSLQTNRGTWRFISDGTDWHLI